MTDVSSDEQGCATSKTAAVASIDDTADEKVHETKNNSPTFDFGDKSWKTDFTLIVEGTRFHVAKIILALASPVFDRMFESEFNESTSDELELPGKKVEEVKSFLLAIYPNAVHVMSKENALKVLPLAEEYQVLNLKQRCEDALLGSIDEQTVTEELFRLINDADLYNLKKLLKKCVSLVLDRPTKDIERANRDIDLPADTFKSIFQNMISRVKELESSNCNKADQLQTFKTLTNYLSKALPKSQFPSLGEDLDWLGQTLVLTIDLKKHNELKDTFNLWNTELMITYVSEQFYGTPIYATITNEDKKEVECAFIIQFTILNKMPKEEHLSVKQKFKFFSGEQSKTFQIAKVSDIENPKKGYAYEGKVQIELNVFMSQPTKLETDND